MEKMRLNKFLRDSGVGSRRKVETLITEGHVAVNGVVVQNLATQITDEVVTLDGVIVRPTATFVYYKFHKPKGYLCSHAKPFDEKIIYDLLPEGLFSVGRLDKDTTGLLLLTNDGTFANKVIHPSSNITKEYEVTTIENISLTHLKWLAAGITVEETFVKPHHIEKTGPHSLKIVIKEGKKREVRLLISDAHLTLLTLKRTRIGGLHLADLPEGQYTPLSETDQNKIFSVEKN